MLAFKGITKRFPGVVANYRIDLEINAAEIHALIGENGAGKSTLMRVLVGLYQPDEGQIYLRGKPVSIPGPLSAIRLGIGMVHQHFMLIPRFTVLENIILGNEPSACGIIDAARARKAVTALCELYDFPMRLDTPVSELSVGGQQRVEIMKVLFRGADVLVLDEPTAVLAPQETEDLFRNLKSLRDQGKTVIFISHKLDEVLSIADRTTVLRRGQVVGTAEAASVTKAQLAEMMVGRPVALTVVKSQVEPGEEALSVHGLTVAGVGRRAVVKDVTFAVREGEIYGVAGVEGNGQAELLEALIGLRPRASGAVRLAGADVSDLPVGERRSRGLCFIPEDRHATGLILGMTIWENQILGRQRDRSFGGGLLDRKAIMAYASQSVSLFDIKAPDLSSPVSTLSGGNQQKVILARELSYDPRVIIASQPMRGLDIAATEFVQKRLLEERSKGKAVLLVSSDLDEVLALSDRVGVMYNGEITVEFRPGDLSKAEIGEYMLGSRKKRGDAA
ncbi:MAG: ABC transporter ATP-binding protein [Firmicutes bacterium]|nr:ABC transporter ATP-binding protein [Bacillota bacterium]